MKMQFPKLATRVAALLVLGAATCAPMTASAAEHIVQVVTDYKNLRMYFKPKLLFIAPGDTVTWVNVVAEEHNVITYPDGYPKGAKGIVSPYMTKEGETWSMTLDVPGTYQYHCIPHLPMGMNGSIVVGMPSAESDFHEPDRAEVAAYRDHLLRFFDSDEFDYKPRNQRASAD